MNASATSPSIIIMGVCGAGKSAIGAALAKHINRPFVEADDFHSTSNRTKMTNGIALTDADRTPWLEAVAKTALAANDGINPVIACSALKRSYRELLSTQLSGALFIHLSADRNILAERLQARKSHFVGVALLESQLASLEPLAKEENGITLDCNQPLTTIIEQIVTYLDNAHKNGLRVNVSQQFTG
ncbi:gluconokinase [Ahrensia sp. 13_GOM-1096m]|uniref:gluconokinase n=1 Tax=Ahrensia sp. 13_GOM-1096m TaxID=1380380 RepID=UPI000688C8CF|nr:gluconokinase [Ahrensia sp. 13_GOM-1096m]